MEAASLRRKDEAERDVTLAWMVAVLGRQAMDGKLKDLRTLLANGAARPQSRDEQRSVLMTLSDYYRIPLKVTH